MKDPAHWYDTNSSTAQDITPRLEKVHLSASALRPSKSDTILTPAMAELWTFLCFRDMKTTGHLKDTQSC